ncbi:MAG: hypothetical protein QOJ57_2260 [Thermoleophilaceae bacterium]|nr:hypothetical protein [Thermoleophilaceae bacterium]
MTGISRSGSPERIAPGVPRRRSTMITRTHTASSVSSTIARENVHQVPDEEPYGAECTPVSVSDRSSPPTLTSSQAKVCSFSPRAIASSRVLGAAAVDAHGATVPVDEVTASPGRHFAEPDRDAVSHHVDVGGADLDAPRTQARSSASTHHSPARSPRRCLPCWWRPTTRSRSSFGRRALETPSRRRM